MEKGMRCKEDNWWFEKGTVCPNCGFDNKVEEEIPAPVKKVKESKPLLAEFDPLR